MVKHALLQLLLELDWFQEMYQAIRGITLSKNISRFPAPFVEQVEFEVNVLIHYDKFYIIQCQNWKVPVMTVVSKYLQLGQRQVKLFYYDKFNA